MALRQGISSLPTTRSARPDATAGYPSPTTPAPTHLLSTESPPDATATPPRLLGRFTGTPPIPICHPGTGISCPSGWGPGWWSGWSGPGIPPTAVDTGVLSSRSFPGMSSHSTTVSLSTTVSPPGTASTSAAMSSFSREADGTTRTPTGSATSGVLTLPLGSSASPTQTALAGAGTGSGAQHKSIPVVAVVVPVVVCLGGAAAALYLWTRRRRRRRHMRAQRYPHTSPQPGSSRSPSHHDALMTEASVHPSAPLVAARRSVATSDTPDHVRRVHCTDVPAVRGETSKQREDEFSREPRTVPAASDAPGDSPPGIPQPEREEPPPYNPSAAVAPHPSPAANAASRGPSDSRC
ncbi:hypothetical protein OH77DRAFT_1430748 [Trametes cingulata]|nr:hypothetical protein OH77DRAFT_1430748 [Trametes cingulata]